MDILISFLLVVVAALIYLKKPLEIKVIHEHRIEQQEVEKKPEDPDLKEDEKPLNIDRVIQSVNEMMGVDYDDDGTRKD